ncbi:uncharacterized protein [Primulina eburnea]|uniref:uncharacterized protein n=1 Tax=Primulina eburnea TaxID=1245227 RepID=UPI003C6C38D7
MASKTGCRLSYSTTVLNGQTRGTVDAAAGGTIFAKSPEQAYDLLEQMTINSYQWPSERAGVKRTAGVYAVDPITPLTAQVSALTTQIAAMNKVSTSDIEGPSLVTEELSTPEEAQYINNRNQGGYGGYKGNPPPNTYHPGLRNHENFSYANNKNVLNPPLGFNTSKGEGKPSLEDLIGTFVAESGKRMLANALKDQNKGQFPSNTEVNPKEQCKAVTLRSGKDLEIHSPKERVDSEKTVEESEPEGSTSEIKVEPLPVYKPTLPYPQRFKKKNLDDQFAKFLEIFKKIHINIPFADALEQMPNYAKFIKDVMSKKRKLQEFETVKLTEECRASINLMPFSIFRKLELGEVKPTTITLQLADRNMEEDHDAPLIFGRPFLATGRALIDVQKGELTLRVGGEEVMFNIYHAMKGSNEE